MTAHLWISDRIENSRRAAVQRHCPKCRDLVLAGPDHDRVAATATVNPAPATPEQEAAALAAGRYTYDLDRGELHIRWPEHINTPRKHPVLIEHRCNPTLGGD